MKLVLLSCKITEIFLYLQNILAIIEKNCLQT